MFDVKMIPLEFRKIFNREFRTIYTSLPPEEKKGMRKAYPLLLGIEYANSKLESCVESLQRINSKFGSIHEENLIFFDEMKRIRQESEKYLH